MKLPSRSRRSFLGSFGPVALLGAFATVLPIDEARADSCFADGPPNTTAASATEALASAERALAASQPEEAAIGFRALALREPSTELGARAALRYVETTTRIATSSERRREPCFDRLSADLPRVIELHCRSASTSKAPSTCETLDRVRVDLGRLHAERKVALADKTNGSEAKRLYEQAAETYMLAFREHCTTSTTVSPSLHCDELAYNAAHAFRAAGLSTRAIDAHKSLVVFDDVRKGQSPLARKSLYELGALYRALTLYESAAEFFELYASRAEAEREAPAALSDAIVMRLALGDVERATKDVDTFVQLFAGSKPVLTADAIFVLAAHAKEHGDTERALAILKGKEALFERSPVDLRIRETALRARAHAETPETAELARGEYAMVVSMWGTGAEALKSLQHEYPEADESQRLRRLGKSLDAVGEALFAAAEDERLAHVETVKPGVYAGPNDGAAILRYVKRTVPGWAQKRRTAIQRAEALYRRITELSPVPPPRWTVDATARVAGMWASFSSDYFLVVPKRMSHPPNADVSSIELLDLAGAGAVRADHAKPAYQQCVMLSVRYQYADELTKGCERWLVGRRLLSPTDELVPGLRTSSPVTFAPLTERSHETEAR